MRLSQEAGLEEAPKGVLLMCETEITQLVTRIVAWLAEHGPDYVQRPPNPGATEAELAELAAYLGHPLPSALAAMLRVANGDFYIGEYVTLSTQAIARTWDIGSQLVADGTYARFEPHYESGGALKPGWWHLGLIPVLEDSCGNQLCIDLDPGPNGAMGQMVWWEIHEGPIPHGADSLHTLLRIHWEHLSSGKYDAPEDWEMADCRELTEVEGHEWNDEG
jgi:cell wall assembly regulator SMI1